MASSQWRVEIDGLRCIGSGMCAGSSPEHFGLEAGQAVALRQLVEPDDAVLDAAETCPMEAILIRRAEDGTLIAPVP